MNMKKITGILVLIMLLPGISHTQPSEIKGVTKFTLGILGGINVPRLSGGDDNEMSRDFKSRSGKAFGLTASMSLGGNYSLRADFLYSSEGGQRNGMQAFSASAINPQAPPGTYLYASYDNESILNYFEIPVLVKYFFPAFESAGFYMNAGPYIGFLMNAKQVIKGTSTVYADRTATIVIVQDPQVFDSETDVTDDINKVNLGVTGGLGFTQKVSYGELFMDVRAAYGMVTIQKDEQNGSNYNGNLLIGIGYSFSF
jgi:hypothetical protein